MINEIQSEGSIGMKRPRSVILSFFVSCCLIVTMTILSTWRSAISLNQTMIWVTSLSSIPCNINSVRGYSLSEVSNTTLDDFVAIDENSFQNEIVQESSHTFHEDNVTRIVARAFEPWSTDIPFPCYEKDDNWNVMKVQNTPSKVGLLYLKPYKTGSSTASGINLRIARNMAERMNKTYDMCKARFDHGPDLKPGSTLFKDRLVNSSFLWTIIRNPTKRSISSFFHFYVSRRKWEPTDENFLKFLDFKDIIEDYYMNALHTKKKFNRQKTNPEVFINEILSDFNFIGITERLDESVIVLMMLLNLKISDILYLSAKTNGGYDDGGGGFGCNIIEPSFVSPGMKEYFDSNAWKDVIQYDLALYEAANKSLDLTIDHLGRTKFEENLALFIKAKEQATLKCLPDTVFPCDNEGVFHPPSETDCLWRDSSCGTTCLDTVATDMELW